MIKAAYADCDITPENGEDLCGFALRTGSNRPGELPLKCRWLSLRDSSNGNVLIGSADILSLSRGTFQEIRKNITNPDISGVGLATTHTHSGPATVRLRHCGKMSRSYMKELQSNIVLSADKAASAKHRNVRIVLGTSSSDWAYNRRNKTGGSVDHEIITLGFIDQSTDRIISTVVNYACHPVVLGHQSNVISPDYPGYLVDFIEKKTDGNCLFLNGACGDLNPVNNHNVDVEEARRAGEAIGAKALAALDTGETLDSSKMNWTTVTVKIPVHQPASIAELDKRLDMLQERFGLARTLFQDRIDNDMRKLKEGRYPRNVEIELSLLAFGSDVAILFVPGELFSSIGLRIKQICPDTRIIISGFSNGSVGYLPDRQAYKDGGYEPYFANFFYDFPEFESDLEDHILHGVKSLFQKAGLV